MSDGESIVCSQCGVSISQGEKFCGKCGKPAGENVSSGPVLGEVASKYQKQIHTKKIRSGRGGLLAVSILQIIGALGVYFIYSGQISNYQEDGYTEYKLADGKTIFERELLEKLEQERVLVVVIVLVAGVIFFGLWLWAKKNPLPATITGLVIFVTLCLADAIVDPTYLLGGILLKIIVIVVLISGVQSALAYRKLQKEQS